jgi:hypothetical protein
MSQSSGTEGVSLDVQDAAAAVNSKTQEAFEGIYQSNVRLFIHPQQTHLTCNLLLTILCVSGCCAVLGDKWKRLRDGL